MSNDSQLSLLLVEDQLTQAMLMQHQLKKAGFAVKLARSGQAALNELDQTTFDLVLTDINMPQMDGYELTRHIKARSTTLPVVLLATPVEHEEILKAIECGADNLLYKAYDEENFLLRLKDIIANMNERGSAADNSMHVNFTFRGSPAKIETSANRSTDIMLSAYDMFIFTLRKQSKVQNAEASPNKA